VVVKSDLNTALTWGTNPETSRRSRKEEMIRFYEE